jgi:hypothetical protein
LSVAVRDPVLVDREHATAQVEAVFAAGLTLEDIRACLDAAVPGARLRVVVDVVFAVGAPAVTAAVSNADAWPRDPSAAQLPPEPVAVQVGQAAGWSQLDWTFHTADGDGRGAYLRTIGVAADPAAGLASGWATNVSATMLSGFDYAFAGEVVIVDGLETSNASLFGESVPASVDESGEPVLTTVTAE